MFRLQAARHIFSRGGAAKKRDASLRSSSLLPPRKILAKETARGGLGCACVGLPGRPCQAELGGDYFDTTLGTPVRAATSQGVAIARSGSGNGALEGLGTGNEMRVRDWRSPGAPSEHGPDVLHRELLRLAGS